MSRRRWHRSSSQTSRGRDHARSSSTLGGGQVPVEMWRLLQHLGGQSGESSPGRWLSALRRSCYLAVSAIACARRITARRQPRVGRPVPREHHQAGDRAWAAEGNEQPTVPLEMLRRARVDRASRSPHSRLRLPRVRGGQGGGTVGPAASGPIVRRTSPRRVPPVRSEPHATWR